MFSEGIVLNRFAGFRTFISFGGSEIYGPFLPSMAGPSDHHVSSCHAEVNAIKYALSLKGIRLRPKATMTKATLLVTRWSKHANANTWQLEDGVPCLSCLKFMSAKGIQNIMISSKSDERMHAVRVSDIIASSRPSRGTR